jgi:hypothetical protein
MSVWLLWSLTSNLSIVLKLNFKFWFMSTLTCHCGRWILQFVELWIYPTLKTISNLLNRVFWYSWLYCKLNALILDSHLDINCLFRSKGVHVCVDFLKMYEKPVRKRDCNWLDFCTLTMHGIVRMISMSGNSRSLTFL